MDMTEFHRLRHLVNVEATKIDYELGLARASNPPVDGNPHIQAAHATLDDMNERLKDLDAWGKAQEPVVSGPPPTVFVDRAALVAWANGQQQQVNLDGQTVHSGFGPPMDWFTQPNGTISQTPPEAPSGPPASTPPPIVAGGGVTNMTIPWTMLGRPSRYPIVPFRGTLAVRIDVPANAQHKYYDGTTSFAEWQGPPQWRNMAISTVPGDFTSPAVLKGAGGLTPLIMFNVGTSPAGVALEAGKTYYINVRNVDAATGQPVEGNFPGSVDFYLPYTPGEELY